MRYHFAYFMALIACTIHYVLLALAWTIDNDGTEDAVLKMTSKFEE